MTATHFSASADELSQIVLRDGVFSRKKRLPLEELRVIEY
jgi:hypothetical protein